MSTRKPDAGMTLIEVVTAMSIMSILMAMFTAGIVQIYRFSNRHEATTTAQAQANLAFLKLEKEIRYAEGVSDPGAVGPDQYVEYLIDDHGVPTCVQLRLNTTSSALQRRTWQQGSPIVNPTAWKDLASSVSSSQPFTVSPADPTFVYQRLQLRLTTHSGAGAAADTAEATVTFTVMNSSPDASDSDLCTEGRATP